ncbi:hypothetical protein [Acidovorax sp. CCYZU-2555]|uniref:hypothetical protein n=1 Tax=Acidovorax sp. CCYZU-2555 TaxID=2835042 RepID=UPI001BCA9883|nr:hypothetical protein [Acidovorax sp. CCYZU-2555]MBS7780080.1 CopD family protein [Acidovorax sp. CCYZU-2555]
MPALVLGRRAPDVWPAPSMPVVTLLFFQLCQFALLRVEWMDSETLNQAFPVDRPKPLRSSHCPSQTLKAAAISGFPITTAGKCCVLGRGHGYPDAETFVALPIALYVTIRCQKRHDLSSATAKLELPLDRWRLHMFWVAIFGAFLFWVLTKFGVLSATVGILTMVIKLLLTAILVGLAAVAWFWLRKKTSAPADKQ